MIHLILPWPPTVNHYWLQRRGGGKYLSKAALDFRNMVWLVARFQGAQGHFRKEDRVCAHIEEFPPDRKIRDIDNVLKALFDALTHAEVWADDSQLDVLIARKRDPVAGGMLKVKLWRSEDNPRRIKNKGPRSLIERMNEVGANKQSRRKRRG